MPLPVISEKNVKDLFPEIDSAAEIGKGGQKLVFRVLREGTPLALKFALLPDTFHADAVDIDETVLRAQRETQIMQDCNSPHMVKLGPIVLGTAVVEGQNVLYFSEELVEGQALNEILRASSTVFCHREFTPEVEYIGDTSINGIVCTFGWDGGNKFCLGQKRRTRYLYPLITNAYLI